MVNEYNNAPYYMLSSLATLALLSSGVFAAAPYIGSLAPVTALGLGVPLIAACAVLSLLVIALSYKAVSKSEVISEKDTQLAKKDRGIEAKIFIIKSDAGSEQKHQEREAAKKRENNEDIDMHLESLFGNASEDEIFYDAVSELDTQSVIETGTTSSETIPESVDGTAAEGAHNAQPGAKLVKPKSRAMSALEVLAISCFPIRQISDWEIA